MSSESESPLDDAEPAYEDPDSQSADTESEDSAVEELWTDRAASRLLEHWLSILLATSVVAAVALAACVYVLQYRPDRQIDDAAARRAIQAASDGAVATLSYSPESMDQDFAKARSHLTGDFLAYYDKFTKEFVIPMVQQKQLRQTATVARAAVSELEANSAVVLVFIDETTTGKDKPQPLMTPSSVRITLTKVNGAWLISKLDPAE
jgi:Mce-associated membrane protein